MRATTQETVQVLSAQKGAPACPFVAGHRERQHKESYERGHTNLDGAHLLAHELGMTELQPANGATAIDEEEPWSYRRKLILAPMVRINSLAFRDLCAEYGCKMLYSEEIVARNLIQSKRMNNEALGTIDFIEPDLGPSKPGGRVCFRTRPGENVVLQLGTACATEALQAANHVADCVKAVDLNMGCPVKFSVQGGMGSALLTEPESGTSSPRYAAICRRPCRSHARSACSKTSRTHYSWPS